MKPLTRTTKMAKAVKNKAHLFALLSASSDYSEPTPGPKDFLQDLLWAKLFRRFLYDRVSGCDFAVLSSAQGPPRPQVVIVR